MKFGFIWENNLNKKTLATLRHILDEWTWNMKLTWVKSTYGMRIRRILKHVAIWTLLILFLITGDLEWQGFTSKEGTLMVPILYGTVFNALVFYMNALYLFPVFWRINNIKFWLYTALFILLVSCTEGWVDLVYANYSGAFQTFYDSLKAEENADPFAHLNPYLTYSLVCLFVHISFWMLSFSYLLPEENIKNIKLENEQLQSELKHLKAQIDPHTLFNGINGIYHLIDEDAELAKNYLHGFANILRHQIYDCREEHILLQNEIAFLERFFQLNQLRHQDDAIISWNLPEYDGSLVIAPILFLPFIENAFKFLSNYNDPNKNTLNACLTLESNRLHFCIENTFQKDLAPPRSGGIGTANVKNRLGLMYPSRHILNIDEANGLFKVDLTLDLNAKN